MPASGRNRAGPVASPDVLIVGTGLAGLALAFAMARRGVDVLVVERDVACRHASTLNARGVRRVNQHPAEMPLAAAAFALWPGFNEMLGPMSGSG